jgi:acetoin utilization deacetylase AcuC-like enzyme
VGAGRARETARGGRIELLATPRLATLHPTGGHPECGERIAVLPFDEEVERVASREQLERVHTAGYLDRLRAIAAPTMLDPDTIATETSWAAATLATGLTLEAVDRSAFALARPPGHHALADRAMGFCLVNCVAVAARYAQAELGLGRVAIVDIDVHHGNGTEAIFRDDPSVLYASLHQWPFYPGTGGPGTSDETTINVPLAAGCGDEEYLAHLDTDVEPAVRAFEPDLLLVSAGVDAHVGDPLAHLELTEAGFTEVGRRCAALGPRVAAVLEGGYNLRTLRALVEAVRAGLTVSRRDP